MVPMGVCQRGGRGATPERTIVVRTRCSFQQGHILTCEAIMPADEPIGLKAVVPRTSSKTPEWQSLEN